MFQLSCNISLRSTFRKKKNKKIKETIKKVAKKFGGIDKTTYLCNRLRQVRAFSSAGLEHLPYKQRVGGSNPSTPTGVFPRGFLFGDSAGIFSFIEAALQSIKAINTRP
jgi:hypothetical protein